MSDALIGTIITCVVTLISIFTTARTTQNKLASEMDKNIALQNAEIDHIKREMSEMREDIKTHNHYAELFSKSMPVAQEQIRMLERRVEKIETRPN